MNIRNLFLPTNKGWAFIDADWSAVEGRIGAILTNESFLLDVFENNSDQYVATYCHMFGIPAPENKIFSKNYIIKSQRQIGKALVLGQNYDMTKYGLATQLKCSKDQAQIYIEQYADAHPMTKIAKANLLEFAKKEGFVRTYFGRVRYIPKLNSQDKKERSSAVREVWNTYIQGTAADILKISMVRLNKILLEKKYRARMVMPIHDEILMQADMMKEDPWVMMEAMKEAMEIDLMGIKLPVEPEWGWRFGSLTTDFEEFIDNTPDPEIKARFKDSKYWQWKADQVEIKKQKATEEAQKQPEKEVELPKLVQAPTIFNNAKEAILVVETDYQKPAITVTLKDDIQLPASFAVAMSQYKVESGLYLYFTIGHMKKTFKYPSRVNPEIMSLLKKLPNAEINKIG